MTLQITLFCRVVDNFGDIGVAWRLARSLAGEHAAQVVLYVDGLPSFTKIAPNIDIALDCQTVQGIEVRRWQLDQPPAVEALGDAVIELFACDTPATYVDAMLIAQQVGSALPIWINLDYLSAEHWVDAAHGQLSLLPNGLKKVFWFPGFSSASGGLLHRFDPSIADEPWTNPTLDEPMSIFAFGYETRPVRRLLQTIYDAKQPVCLALPQGVWGYADRLPVRAHIDLIRVPFIAQEQFDLRLASNTLNIVRGEDSFVRAQLLARPLIWHIYPQDDGAHLFKLDAWLNRYCEGLMPDAAAAYRQIHVYLNDQNLELTDARWALAWQRFCEHLPAVRERALQWRDYLCNLPELAAGLVERIKRPL
jgi:uncharacterized repeat protein (TIGR03837 family)